MSETTDSSSSPEWTQLDTHTGLNGYPVYLWQCCDRPEPLYKATIFLHAPWSWIGYRSPDEALKRCGITPPAREPVPAAENVPVTEAMNVDVLVAGADAAPEPDAASEVNPTPIPAAEVKPAPELVDKVGQVAMF